MKKYFNDTTNNKGQTVLVLVLLTALIGVLSILLTQQLGRRQQKQLTQIEQIDRTYYATEGALYETLEHLIGDSSWPATTPYTDTYEINGVQISRTIEKINNGSEEVRQVDITGNYEGITRRVTGEDIILSSTSSKKPLDLVLSIDLSTSMWDVEDGTGEWQPIGGTKDAASNFVGLLDTDTDRVGLFGWGSNCLNSFPVPVPEPFDYVNCLADWLYNELRTDDPLPSHFGIVQSTINNINSDEPRGDNLDGTFDHEDGTAIDLAIKTVTQYIEETETANPPTDPDTVVAHILLSDGLTNNPVWCCSSSQNAPDPTSMNICEWREAENYNSQNNVTVGTETDPLLTPPANRTFMTPQNPGSYARYRVNIATSGIYEPIGENFSANAAQSSFTVYFRNVSTGEIQGPELWNQNQYNKWQLQSDNRPFELEAGTYDFFITYNEPQHKIDKFLIQPACGKVAAINAAIEAANTDVDLGTSIQNGIPIYTIGLGENSDNFTLQRIADETDGTYHFSPTTAELDQIFQDIVEEIRTGLADYSLDEQVP